MICIYGLLGKSNRGCAAPPSIKICLTCVTNLNYSKALSKATVYNGLNALVDKGLLTALTITSEEARYDFKREPHHHFLCKHCGSILDVKVKCTYADVAEVEGHRVEDIRGYFKGTCKKCLRGG